MSQLPFIHISLTLMRCRWLQWNGSWLTEAEVTGDANGACGVWHCSPCAVQEQQRWECLFLPDPAPSPLPNSWLRQEASPHVLGIKHGHGGCLHRLAPHLGTWPRCSGPAPWHNPCFHKQHILPWVSLKCLFAPSLTARLKSSYHRQRERNILQVCNSLKHWTCSNMSLLSGRKEGRHVQAVVYSNTPVEFGSISTD